MSAVSPSPSRPSEPAADTSDGPVWLPQERNLQEAREALQAWAEGALGIDPSLRVGEVDVPGGGHASTETLMFNLLDGEGRIREELVARIEPTDWQVFMENDLENQFLVMKALGGTKVPVPGVRAFEQDASVLGSRFMVTQKVIGMVPTEDPLVQPAAGSWLWDATSDDRATLWRSSIEALAEIHGIDTPSLGLARLHRSGRTGTGLEREFSYWKDFADWVGPTAHSPLLQLAWQWMVDNFPTESETALAWGDARIQNMMYGADFKVTAVLDWEMATMAGPLSDLGWWLVNDRSMAEVVIDTPQQWRIDGFGSREETIGLWEELTGRSAEGIEWYEVFGAWRLAVILARLLPMLEPHGIVPDYGMNAVDNTGTHDLARMFDRHDLLPAPAPPARSPRLH